ncbi:UNVERIFIED_CONTAM: hypothetical protein PYX00_007361 [Menopon gallinae]|uniref:Uncharacterized protein n=1 Tax=Menopon gallinae TaxID=328185 RepID=A0AAW2HJN3_9NEOP
MTTVTVKCRKCRNLLFTYPEVDLLSAHGESYGSVGVEYIKCETIQEDNVWFLGESGMPDWVSSLVNEANWTKGKVNCPKCNSRLGSFDFISGTQCQCGSHTLPPVHVVKCKVDCRVQMPKVS